MNALVGPGVLPDDTIIQQEDEKRFGHHGIKIRPGMIVHIPFERGLAESRPRKFCGSGVEASLP